MSKSSYSCDARKERINVQRSSSFEERTKKVVSPYYICVPVIFHESDLIEALMASFGSMDTKHEGIYTTRSD